MTIITEWSRYFNLKGLFGEKTVKTAKNLDISR